ncbi:MAG: LapA family protein [Nitrospinaceae bacterium]|jgi:uncharacterized integral membrane protein
MPVKFILFIILSIIVAIFAVKNMGMVEVSFYDFSLNSHKYPVPLLVVILVSLAFGFFLAWIDGWVAKMKLKSIIRRNNKTIESLDEELRKYRKPSLPEYTESEK